MALPPNLPPQAYTRDTLVKAIEWLTTQPAAMRERANSADLIVSHYLAARRRTPYSGESAAADFRHLADELRQPAAALGASSEAESEVDDEVTFTSAPAEASTPLTPPSPPAQPAPRPPRRREPPRVAPTPENHVGHARGTPDTEANGSEVAVTLKGLVWTVDQRSRAIAREVQDRMNLSSESEALRMLVAMGAERLRSVLP